MENPTADSPTHHLHRWRLQVLRPPRTCFSPCILQFQTNGFKMLGRSKYAYKTRCCRPNSRISADVSLRGPIRAAPSGKDDFADGTHTGTSALWPWATSRFWPDCHGSWSLSQESDGWSCDWWGAVASGPISGFKSRNWQAAQQSWSFCFEWIEFSQVAAACFGNISRTCRDYRN